MNNIHVVVGVIIHDKSILIARRSEDKHQGGVWEFPGGKVKSNETPYNALIRELREEVGIVARKARPLIRFTYKYPDRSILIDAWFVREWDGEVDSCEKQEIRWISLADLPEYTMPPANKMIIKAIRLPSLYLICPKLIASYENYLKKMETCLKAGVELIQLRCGDEAFDANPDFIYQIIDLCNYHGAKILLNSTPENAVLYNAHGVHLSSNRLMQFNKRPLDHNKYVGASCHDMNELIHASEIDVDFIVLSPVNKTETHPESETLGWDNFSRLVQNINIPVYALGGMRSCHLKTSWDHGAQGIAIQKYIWDAKNSADNIKKCLVSR